MRLLSVAERGVVMDEHEGVHPDILQHFHGIENNPDVDESDSGSETSDDINLQIFNGIQEQFEGNKIAATHEAVDVPNNLSPFGLDESLELFREVLTQTQLEDIVPFGYGVTPDELETSGYPLQEILRGGRRGRKEKCVLLSVEVWLPRAIKWCQALEVMSTILIEE